MYALSCNDTSRYFSDAITRYRWIRLGAGFVRLDKLVQVGVAGGVHLRQLAEALVVHEADLVVVRVREDDDAHGGLPRRVEGYERRQDLFLGLLDLLFDERLLVERAGERDASVGLRSVHGLTCNVYNSLFVIVLYSVL